jgi:hypothetical protein
MKNLPGSFLAFLLCAVLPPLMSQNSGQMSFSDGDSHVLSKRANFRLLATRTDNWDSLQRNWVYADSLRYTYRNGGALPESMQTFRFLGGKWSLLLRENFSYDGKNNHTFSLRQIWAGTQWTDDVRSIYAYDANNNRLVAQSQSWSGSLWKDVSKSLYEYDSDNNRTKWTRQKIQNNAWLNQLRYVYEYDTARRLVTQTTCSWNINEGIWENVQLASYNYNAAGQQTEELVKTWKDGAWIPQLRNLSSYDNGNNQLIASYKEVWRNGSWHIYGKQQMDYDKARLIRSSEYAWTGLSWQNTALYENRYDLNDNQVYMRYAMGGHGSNWINAQQTFSYYESLVSQTGQAEQGPDFSVIPNLGSGVFSIAYTDAADPLQKIIITNLNGQSVMQMDVEQHPDSVMDLTRFPDGLYYIRILTKHGKQGMRQFVKAN